jgi:lipopolysaccharide heptosyltransferase II
MKLSAVVVTRNEEKNIARCLHSLSFADEIIIVDSKSPDRTAAIAKKYTKKIFLRDFIDFSSAKNFGIEKASGQWILSVDADEAVTPGLRAKIGEIIHAGAGEDGYGIRRANFFLGREIKHCGWGRDYQLRLFRKKNNRFQGAVHEAVRVKGLTGRIEQPLMHYSYTDSGSYFEKMNRYTSMQAENSKPFAAARMIMAPPLKFFSMYFLKLGFLDGWHGFVLCCYSAFSEFVKYAKMLKDRPDTEKLLVRAPNWVGDCVVATAFLGRLKEKYGKLYLLARKGTEGIFEGNPAIDEIIVFDKRNFLSVLAAVFRIREKRIGTAVSLSPSLSSHLMLIAGGVKGRFGYADDMGGLLLNSAYKRDKSHRREHVMEEYKRVFYLLNGSFDFSGIKQEIFINKEQEKDFLRKFRVPGSGFRIVIAPFAGFGPSKTWPLQHYEHVAKMILRKSKKAQVYMTGGNDDKKTDIDAELLKSEQFHDMRGISLTGAACLIKNASVFIGNDSGLMHIADAYSVPVIAIFGATAPFWGGPVSKKAKVIYLGIECQPCFKKTCRFGHYRCLNNINPEAILKLIKI